MHVSVDSLDNGVTNGKTWKRYMKQTPQQAHIRKRPSRSLRIDTKQSTDLSETLADTNHIITPQHQDDNSIFDDIFHQARRERSRILRAKNDCNIPSISPVWKPLDAFSYPSAFKRPMRNISYKNKEFIFLKNETKTECDKTNQWTFSTSTNIEPSLGTSATLIQASWRSSRARRIYFGKCLSALRIQACWRGYKVRLRMRNRGYHDTGSISFVPNHEKLVLKLQAFGRAWLSQRRECQKRIADERRCRAANIVQCCFRRYLRRKSAAVVLQSFLRMTRAVIAYSSMRTSTIQLQAHWRRIMFEYKYMRARKAVLTIQCRVRFWQAQSFYRKGCALKKIQTWFRRISVLRNFSLQRICAIKIQSIFRCFTGRNMYLQKRYRIQQAARRRRLFLLSMEKNRAATTIQKHWKSAVVYTKYQHARCSIILLQATMRGFVCRRQYAEAMSASIRIQAWARMIVQTVIYSYQRASVVAIQGMIRRYVVRRTYMSNVRAILLMQKSLRRYRSEQLARAVAAIAIQSFWRMIVSLCRSRDKRASIIFIQAQFRGSIERSKFLNTRAWTITIQSWFRTRRALLRYSDKRGYAILIARQYRASLHQRRYIEKRLAALRIQRILRVWSDRRAHFNNKTAMKLQTFLRMALAFSSYRRAGASAVLIQAIWRAYCCRGRFRRMRSAASVIQSWFQTLNCTSLYKECRVCVILIQSTYRRYRCNGVLLNNGAYAGLSERLPRCQSSIEAIVQIQASWRSRALSVNYARWRVRLVILQNFFRRCFFRSRFLLMKASAIKLQSSFRCMRDRTYFKKIKAAQLLQSFIRFAIDRKRLKSECLSLSTPVKYSRIRLSVENISPISNTSVFVEFSPILSFRQHRAAKLIQGFARKRWARGFPLPHSIPDQCPMTWPSAGQTFFISSLPFTLTEYIEDIVTQDLVRALKNDCLTLEKIYGPCIKSYIERKLVFGSERAYGSC